MGTVRAPAHLTPTRWGWCEVCSCLLILAAMSCLKPEPSTVSFRFSYGRGSSVSLHASDVTRAMTLTWLLVERPDDVNEAEGPVTQLKNVGY